MGEVAREVGWNAGISLEEDREVLGNAESQWFIHKTQNNVTNEVSWDHFTYVRYIVKAAGGKRCGLWDGFLKNKLCF